jgi:uncharacterized protein YaiL (DUF2058 family)
MSLRDQLMKAGLVDKKQVAKTNRQLKKKRRREQASRERQTVIDVRASEESKKRIQSRKEERRQRRKQADENREQANLARLVGNLIRSYGRSIPEGRQLFFHRLPLGPRLGRLKIPLEVALDLRSGRTAIAWSGSEDDPQLLLIPRATAHRILGHEPGRVLFFNLEPPEASDPSEQLAGFERLHTKE